MNFLSSPNAFFDILMLSELTQTNVGPLYPEEFHVLGYLACVLELYRAHQPISSWGYDFAGTKDGRPFSPALDAALTELQNQGYLRRLESGALILTDEGRRELEVWKELPTFQTRLPSLEGASKSTLSVPLDYVRNAIAAQPVLRSGASVQSVRPLLNSADLENIYSQFEAISAAIGVEIRELMIPGVIWLKYLTKAAEQAEP